MKDKELLKSAGLSKKAKQLVGDLSCFYSRRINWQHRLIYRVDEEHQIVYVDSMWSHYER